VNAALIADDTPQTALRILVRPGVDIHTVTWRGAVVADGECEPMSDWMNTPKDAYQAGDPIIFMLGGFAEPEVCLEITAVNEQTGLPLDETLFFRMIVGK
jgi:hypothetical protein